MEQMEFGVVVHGVSSWSDLNRLVIRAEELGYGVVATPDHLGSAAPFTVLAAVAGMSSGLRLRTYMLNVGFWNSALLAREAATVDVLSDGRLELGLGAGHMNPLEQRIARLGRTALEVRQVLADIRQVPPPVQRPIPIAIGAMSRRGLEVDARRADIVGFAGLRQVPGASPGTFTLVDDAALTTMVRHVKAVASGRAYRSEALLQVVALGDPQHAAEEIASKVTGLTPQEALASPVRSHRRRRRDCGRRTAPPSGAVRDRLLDDTRIQP
jgi:alkanesulfonate monooxygenase SsuD/methylene tetrahydromethanopterin reductase-like flavin-dependent oxidoreductase (luciferase family)